MSLRSSWLAAEQSSTESAGAGDASARVQILPAKKY